MLVGMAELDAAVFHQYAEYLWRRAGRIIARWAVVGALVGCALGAVMLSSWADWPLQHREAYLLMALGAISGAVLGRSLGSARVFGLRLQAQLVQHQLQFERSTLAQSQAASEPERPLSYAPTGVPPVSAPEPAAAEPAAAAPASAPERAEIHGGQAIGPQPGPEPPLPYVSSGLPLIWAPAPAAPASAAVESEPAAAESGSVTADSESATTSRVSARDSAPTYGWRAGESTAA